jgi:uncharacterized protein (TIGR00106 family)
MILTEVTYITIGKGVSAADYVNMALGYFRKSGVKFYPNSMSTVLETETVEEALSIVAGAEDELIKSGVPRVETVIKIDHRVDIDNSVSRKLEAIGLRVQP